MTDRCISEFNQLREKVMDKIFNGLAGVVLALVGGVGIGVLWWSPSLYGLFFGVALIVV